MSLVDEARLEVRTQGGICTVQGLDPELIAEIQEALDAGINARAIGRALKNRGVSLTGDVIRRHFVRHECACPS